MKHQPDMTRTEKKCFIATAALHGLLVVILFFGSALMPYPTDTETPTPVTVFSSAEVDMLLKTKGGDEGGPSGAPAEQPKPPVADPIPAPPPKAVDPQPETKVETAPPPIKEPTRLVEPPKIVEVPPIETPPKKSVDRNETRIPVPPTKKPKSKPIVKPKLVEESEETPTKSVKTTKTDKPPVHKNLLNPDDLKKSIRSTTDSDAQARAEQAAADAAARAEARANQKRTQGQVASILNHLGSGLSSGTLVKTTPGFGGGGPVSVNYADLIFSKYYNAWVPPLTLDSDVTPVEVRVTISRDGRVVGAHVVRPSGNKLMDRSVANALENVTFIQPFPESSTQQEKTVTIEFNLQAKRQTG